MIDDLVCDGRFDARLVRENKSAKGIFLTLEIAADDYYAAKLSNVRPHALLRIGYQELVDVSVQPIEVPACRVNHAAYVGKCPGCHAVLPGIPKQIEHKPRDRFEDMPLVKQCVLRCGDDRFQYYLRSHFATVWGLNDFGAVAPHVIAARVVRTICNVASRADLGTDERGAKEWRTLEDGYRQWLLDQRYPADARR